MGFNLCGRVLVRAEGATCLTELMAPIDAPFVNNLPAFPLLVLVLLNEHVQVSSSIHVQKIRKAWVSRLSENRARSKITNSIEQMCSDSWLILKAFPCWDNPKLRSFILFIAYL